MSLENFPFLQSANHNKIVKIGNKVKVILRGQWPTPSWFHKNTRINYNQNELTVDIEYMGTQKPGISLQIIKPFSDIVYLIFPLPGNWQINCHSRVKKIITKIEVKE